MQSLNSAGVEAKGTSRDSNFSFTAWTQTTEGLPDLEY